MPKRSPYADWREAFAEDVDRTAHWNSAREGTKWIKRKDPELVEQGFGNLGSELRSAEGSRL